MGLGLSNRVQVSGFRIQSPDFRMWGWMFKVFVLGLRVRFYVSRFGVSV